MKLSMIAAIVACLSAGAASTAWAGPTRDLFESRERTHFVRETPPPREREVVRRPREPSPIAIRAQREGPRVHYAQHVGDVVPLRRSRR
jgi:hypothetical protein